MKVGNCVFGNPWENPNFFQIGQMHSGFLGQLQSILSKCSDHIWFERSESKDRALITNRYVNF